MAQLELAQNKANNCGRRNILVRHVLMSGGNAIAELVFWWQAGKVMVSMRGWIESKEKAE